jgi:hypothetical protein
LGKKLVTTLRHTEGKLRSLHLEKWESGAKPPLNSSLKVPKREIFDRSDFPDFYTIKSLCVGDFRVKKEKKIKNILGFI